MDFFAQKNVWNIKLKDIAAYVTSKNKDPKLNSTWNLLACLAGLILLLVIGINSYAPMRQLLSPLAGSLRPLSRSKVNEEVFDFAPYWNINSGKLSNVDFKDMTTFAYFGIPVNSDGTLAKDDIGYQTFMSEQATQLFEKAHANNTRVVLTLTQMDNATIEQFLSDPNAQKEAISEAVDTVSKRGIDGINVDFEYSGDPGVDYRNAYSNFIANLTKAMHKKVSGSQVSVSVYADSAIDPKLYDISSLAKNSDKIFMMGYDFATAGSDYAMPTAPLYGAKKGVYWYDVSSAVSDFLKQMPANKLVLGMPEYGYEYTVYSPGIKAETLPGYAQSDTNAYVAANITPAAVGSSNYEQGWDNYGQVEWKAYYDSYNEVWHMVFVEDPKSISEKVQFAKSENLAGVGIWALGNGSNSLQNVIAQALNGSRIADSNTY